MKRKLARFVLAFLSCQLIILACSREGVDENLDYDYGSLSALDVPLIEHDISKLVFDGKKLEFEVNSSSLKLVYKAESGKAGIDSRLKIEGPGIKPYQIDYAFNANIKYWKLLQADSVIEESNGLKRMGHSVSVLKQLVDLLESVYGKLPFDSGKDNPSLLISSISFHKSIINTAATSIAQNRECECTVHPFFLTGKTPFNCQEEHFYEAAGLAESVNRLLQEDSVNDFGLKLRSYLAGNKKRLIRFDEFYSLYVDKATFMASVESQKTKAEKKLVTLYPAETVQAGMFPISSLLGLLFTTNSSATESESAVEVPDCGDECIMGCGSDHGCCGNYEGCCYYVHGICMIHDDICTNCTPRWFCTRWCVPD